jgi:hypothetical protein
LPHFYGCELAVEAALSDVYGDRFLRIESVAKAADGTLRSLDLQNADVREAVRNFEGGKISALYVSERAMPYK